ncbi:MAG: hypothetical protein JXR96_15525 [Deltaproteobacteria bacterium]|nr:hypothetical protein [Deltaproteobacteria bacterium]
MKTSRLAPVLLAGMLAACGGGSGSPVLFEGSIQSIDETAVSWDELKLGLLCMESLTENSNYVYRANQIYRSQAIGSDRRFSFELPAEIEDAWVGSYPFDGSSGHFMPVAYNDSNGDDVLDCDPEVFLECSEPISWLWEGGETIGLIFVRDPSRVMGAPEDMRGWILVEGLSGYSQDFDREFTLEKQTL